MFEKEICSLKNTSFKAVDIPRVCNRFEITIEVSRISSAPSRKTSELKYYLKNLKKSAVKNTLRFISTQGELMLEQTSQNSSVFQNAN